MRHRNLQPVSQPIEPLHSRQRLPRLYPEGCVFARLLRLEIHGVVEHVGDVDLGDEGNVMRREASRYVHEGSRSAREVEGGLSIESVYGFKVTDGRWFFLLLEGN